MLENVVEAKGYRVVDRSVRTVRELPGVDQGVGLRLEVTEHQALEDLHHD